MHVLVTGAAGFIGAHLVRGLCAAGHRVRGVDDFSAGSPRALAGCDIELRRADVTSAAAMHAAMEGIDCVLHHAARVSAPASLVDPAGTFRVNVGGTECVLRTAAAARVRRVVLASSAAVYGHAGALQHEEAPLLPMTPYGESKLRAEARVRAAMARSNLACVVLRYFNVYGPHLGDPGGHGAVMARLARAAAAGHAPRIDGDGRQRRDFVHVDDVVRATLQAALLPAAAGATLNIGSGIAVSVNGAWRRLAALAGAHVAPVYGAARPGDVRISRADPRAAVTTLSFATAVTLDAGCRSMLASARAHLGAVVAAS